MNDWLIYAPCSPRLMQTEHWEQNLHASTLSPIRPIEVFSTNLTDNSLNINGHVFEFETKFITH